MKKKKLYVGIDYLKIACTTSQEVMNNLLERDYLQLNGIEIIKINEQEKVKTYSVNIYDYDYETSSLIKIKMGTMTIGSIFDKDKEPPKHIWFKVANKFLYTHFECIPSYLEELMSELHLTFNNITRLDIFVDAEIKFPYVFRKAIRNKELEIIFKGNKITDRKENVNDILHIGTGNWDRLNALTLTIKSSDDSTPSLTAYNKSKEIKELSKKEYIKSYDNKLNPNKISRAEIKLANECIKNTLNKECMTLGEFLHLFSNKQFLLALWEYYTGRILRFNMGKNKQLSILDVDSISLLEKGGVKAQKSCYQLIFELVE